jgi:hypothetical protein
MNSIPIVVHFNRISMLMQYFYAKKQVGIPPLIPFGPIYHRLVNEAAGILYEIQVEEKTHGRSKSKKRKV